MQYPVPQFQDVEDKIIGPFTFKQFIYILGGGGLSYVILQTIPGPFNLLLIAPVVALSAALAFYKINRQPFINIVEYAFYYSIKHKLYLWSHKRKRKVQQEVARVSGQEAPVAVPTLSSSQMKDLAWNLDINENVSRAQNAKDIALRNVLSEV